MKFFMRSLALVLAMQAVTGYAAAMGEQKTLSSEIETKLTALASEITSFVTDAQASLKQNLAQTQGLPRQQLIIIHDRIESYIKKMDALVVALSVLDKPLALTNRDAYKMAEALISMLKSLKSFVSTANASLKNVAEHLP